MIWKSFQPFPGLKVSGDKSRWPTILLLKGLYLMFHWNLRVVLEPQEETDGYYVGFTDQFGKTFVRTKKITSPRFAGLLGHEDCVFFAVTSLEDPRPLTLREVSRVPKNAPLDPEYVTRI